MIRALRLLRLFRRPDEWLRLQILVDLRGHHRRGARAKLDTPWLNTGGLQRQVSALSSIRRD